jgi:hypothetical protein
MDVWEWLEVQNLRLRAYIARQERDLSACQAKLAAQILEARARGRE